MLQAVSRQAVRSHDMKYVQRPGLYVMVFIILLNSCEEVGLLRHHFVEPDTCEIVLEENK